jgi:hypothetical protein
MSASTPTEPSPSPERPGGAGLRSHPGRVLLGAGALLVVALVLTSRLGLRTAFSELLPSDDPGVVALQKTSKRIGDMSLLLVGIHSPDPAANVRYAEVLTSKLRALPRDVASLATYNVRDVRDFFEVNKWLYVAEPDLESIRDRLRKEISQRKNPLFVDLGGDEDESLDSMQKRIAGGSDKLGDRFPDGLFATADKNYVWVATLPPGGLFVEHAGDSLWSEVNRLVAENPPQAYHPHMTVQLGGPVATAIASRQAIERDILGVTLTCVVIVAASIALYFRRLRSLPLIGAPAVLGTLLAFAVAEVAFGYLTSSTAFLGSIIVGNGINYAIVLLSRYEEDRVRGMASPAAMDAAIRDTWRATGVASLSASAAYASLMVTSFRGFYQFGVMASAGALMCWGATYTVLPAMIAILDQRERKRQREGKASKGSRPVRPPFRLDALSRVSSRHFRPLVLGLGTLTVVATFGGRHFLQDPFEYDFRKLNAKIESTDEAKQFGQKVDQIFGRWPSPTIIVADSVSGVEAIRSTIRKQDRERSKSDPLHREVIGQITTVWDLLPGTPEVQARKLQILAQIRKLVADPALEAASPDERAKLAKVDPSPGLHALGPGDLPPIARRPFTEVDGSVGKVVLVYPIEHGISVWSGQGSAPDGLGAAGASPPGWQHPRDLGQRGGLRGHDPLGAAGRADRHGRVVAGGAGDRDAHHPAGAGGRACPRDLAARGAVDGRRRRVGGRSRHLPELHRPADHLRHRRRVCPQRGVALPTGRRHQPGHQLDRRGGGAVLLDHHRRLWLAAGGAQSGAPRLRPHGHPRRDLLPRRRPHGAAGGLIVVGRSGESLRVGPSVPLGPDDGSGAASEAGWGASATRVVSARDRKTPAVEAIRKSPISTHTTPKVR